MSTRNLSKRSGLSLAGLLLMAGAASAQDALTASEVQAKLEAQGFTNVNDVEFEDGVWTADARSADGNRVDVSIDPATGKIYPEAGVARLGEADIKARLAAAGYGKVHDLEFEDGLWKAEADNAQGQKMELRVDPATGKVIGEARD